MPFLAVDNVKLSCSYGTCSSRLKVSPFSLPHGYFRMFLDDSGIPDAASLSASVSVPHGIVKVFDALGNLKNQSVYVNGVLEGESVFYNAAGQIIQKAMFVGGKIHGMLSTYTNGVLTAAISFRDGLMHGASKFYNVQGKLALQTNFAEGLEDGLRISFDVGTGAILKKALFIKGYLEGTAGAALGKALSLQGRMQAGVRGALAHVPNLDIYLDMNLDLTINGWAAVDGQTIATIMDHVPYQNIFPFCLCTSLANPAVAAATKKANGVLTPQPCTPKTESPWVSGSHAMMLQDNPALTDSSKLICAYAGVIGVEDAVQDKADIA